MVSCLPCHDRKIKCNRGHPCDRCNSAGRPDECTYQQSDGTRQPHRNPIPSRYPLVASFTDNKARTGTSTSWARLLWDVSFPNPSRSDRPGTEAAQFEEARDYLFGIDPEYNYMYKRVKGLKTLFAPAQSTNFPFGDPSSDLKSLEYLLSQLPERDVVEALLHNYMRTYEKLFPLWHQASFEEEMASFWASPQDTGRNFLAQIFMMLALSCHSAPSGIPALRQLDLVEISHSLFGLADAAFKGSQFMMVHDLAVVRTLSMAAMAKIMDLITFNDTKSCSPLLGLLVRLAESMSMHRHPSLFPEMPEYEGLNRIKIWTTIAFIDVMSSVSSCLPLLIRNEDHDVFPYSDTARTSSMEARDNEQPGSMTGEVSEAQMLLSGALPLTSSIVATANSVKSEHTYEQVENIDKRLRHILNMLSKVNMDDGLDAFSLQGLMLQRAMLQIFIRRMLLILHEPFARDPKNPASHTSSRFAVMECSLSLLHCHSKLSEAATLGNPVQWFLNFFKEDFGIATIYVARAIRRNDFDYTDAQVLPHTCPKEIVWTALRQATEIFEAHAADSVNHFRIYMGSVYLLAALESLQSGCPMLDKMIEAGLTIIRIIHTKKGKEVSDMDLSSPSGRTSIVRTPISPGDADDASRDWTRVGYDPMCFD